MQLLIVVIFGVVLLTCNCQQTYHQRVYYRYLSSQKPHFNDTFNDTSNSTKTSQSTTKNTTPTPQTYIIDDNGFTLNESLEWCNEMSGVLPVIRSPEDLNFLIDEVFMRGSPGYCENTWLGLHPVFLSSLPKAKKPKHNQKKYLWMDNSTVDYALPFASRSYCAQEDCCGLHAGINLEDHRGTVWFSDCQARHRRVCILQGVWSPESLGIQPYFDKSSKISEVISQKEVSQGLFHLFIFLIVVAGLLLILVLITMRQLIRKTRDKENIESVIPTRYQLSDMVHTTSCVDSFSPTTNAPTGNSASTTPQVTPRTSRNLSRPTLVNNNLYDSYEPVSQRDTIELTTFGRSNSKE